MDSSSMDTLVLMFQSTHPRGVRQVDKYIATGELPVSIHAPARGATGCGGDMINSAKGFNPRTREGCDWGRYGFPESLRLFQSTHPRGVRLSFAHTPIQEFHRFNPRTREGCDQGDIGSLHIAQRFQSTHPRGVRLAVIFFPGQASQFQSTHPRGVRRHPQERK